MVFVSPAGFNLLKTGIGHQYRGKKPAQAEQSVQHLQQKPVASVRFEGSRANPALLAKYGLDPKTMKVVAPLGVPLPDTALILTKLAEAHEHALKNKYLGNYSGFYRATNLMMENGTWGLATNIENSRDVGILCGERSAITVAWNRALCNLRLESLENPARLAKAREKMKVKLMVLTSADPMGTPSAGRPCAECLSWMATDKYFSPHTLIAAIRKDEQTGKPYLLIRQLREMLPHWGRQTPSVTSRNIEHMPVVISPKASQAFLKKGVRHDLIRKLMQQAQREYRQNRFAEFSGKNTATAVLFSDKTILTGSRFDWTARWFVPPDLGTVAQGYRQNTGRQSPPTVEAVAYYGDDPNLPAVTSMGILAQPTRGGPDTLLAVIQQDQLHIRTIEDYITDIYLWSPKPPAATPAASLSNTTSPA